MKYLFKPGDGEERRINPRKKTKEAIPIEVKDLPTEQGGSERSGSKNVQALKPISYEHLRETPWKKTPAEIKASILTNGFSTGRIEDLSRGGLKISSVIRLQQGREIGIYFMLPGQNKGITLICQVRWFKEYEQEGTYHLVGLKILKTSDDQGFCAFVDTLPPLKAAVN